MMTEHQVSVPAGMGHKKELLNSIYGVYSRWVERFPLACQKGCATCCTQSVTMTSLEGEMLLDFLKVQGMVNRLPDQFAQKTTGNKGAAITTNQFAKACLEQQKIDEDPLGSWDFTPCIFLSEGVCTIYEVRPFGCRSFGSVLG